MRPLSAHDDGATARSSGSGDAAGPAARALSALLQPSRARLPARPLPRGGPQQSAPDRADRAHEGDRDRAAGRGTGANPGDPVRRRSSALRAVGQDARGVRRLPRQPLAAQEPRPPVRGLRAAAARAARPQARPDRLRARLRRAPGSRGPRLCLGRRAGRAVRDCGGPRLPQPLRRLRATAAGGDGVRLAGRRGAGGIAAGGVRRRRQILRSDLAGRDCAGGPRGPRRARRNGRPAAYAELPSSRGIVPRWRTRPSTASWPPQAPDRRRPGARAARGAAPGSCSAPTAWR